MEAGGVEDAFIYITIYTIYKSSTTYMSSDVEAGGVEDAFIYTMNVYIYYEYEEDLYIEI